MLHSLRRAAKSWVAKLLIALLVLSFAVWGIGDIFSFRGGTAIATVGEQEVTADQYADALLRQQARLSQQAGRAVMIAEMREIGFDRRILAGLVRDAALNAELDAAGITAPDRAIADAIRENPAFLGPAGNFSEQAYRVLLSQQRMTPAEFEALTRDLIGQQILSSAAAGTDVTAPGLATRIAAWQGETRNVRLLTLDARQAEDPGEPDDATLQAFQDENAERFREPERRYGRYLHVDIAALTAEAREDLTEEQLRVAYEAEAGTYATEPTRTVEQITFPSLAEAEAAAERLSAAEIDFEALAAELGQEGALAIGEVRPGDLPEGADAAVFALDTPGVTGAVQTTLGGAILRVTAVTEGGAVPFDAVQDEIADRLALEQAMIRAPEVANQVEELRAAGQTFAEIAEEAGPGVVAGEIPGLAADGTLEGAEEATGVLAAPAAAAEIADALDAEERDMVELADGGYFLAYVERVEPSRLPDLAEIRDRVEAAWREEAVLKTLEERAGRIAAAIERGTGATLDSTAAGMGRTATETGFFPRTAAPATVPPDMVAPIFAAEAGEVVTGRLDDGSGVVLAEVVEVRPMPPEALALATEQIDIALAQSIRRDREEYFTRAVEDHHGALFNPQAIEQVFVSLTGGGS